MLQRIARHWRYLLLLLLSLPLLWLFAAGLGLRHQLRLQPVPGMALPASGESFAAYRERMAVRLAPWVSPAFPPETLDWRLPFEWVPVAGCDPGQDRGVLLFHGLTDSPFSLRDLAAVLVRQCQTVRVILLPGHGTVPGDLLTVRLEDWQQAVDVAVSDFRAAHPRMLLGGYSLGGALAVDYVRRHPGEAPSGLLLVAPALALDSSALWALPILETLSHLFPRLAWLEIHDDGNPVKYESFAVNAAWQMARLDEALRGQASIAAVPVWASLTADDATVNAPASLALLCRMAAPSSHLIWYGRELPAQACKAVHWEKPEGGVLDYSHVALPFSPDNVVYGQHPLYYNCVHYAPDSLQWRVCKGMESLDGKVPVLGEITKANLGVPVLRRLTYNPAFGRMTADMTRFIGALDASTAP